jgi:hypothetical protein
MTRWTTRLGAALLVAAAGPGCATQGVGSGDLAPRYEAAQRNVGRVIFRWESDGPSATRGRITAILPDGESFTGEYRQPAQNLQTYGPDWYKTEPGMVWPPTHPGEPDAFFIGGVPTDHVLPEYSGRLLAILKGPGGATMRCWLHLDQPRHGPAGGASGTCRLSDGERIDDARLGGPPGNGIKVARQP